MATGTDLLFDTKMYWLVRHSGYYVTSAVNVFAEENSVCFISMVSASNVDPNPFSYVAVEYSTHNSSSLQ